MDSLTFTINLKDLDACDGDFDQLVSDIQAFINILHHASPDYIEAGNILQEQLDEQVKKHKEETDPREMFRKKLDSVSPFDVNNDIASAGFWEHYNDLRDTIGGTPMVVAYAAYKLAKYIEEQSLSAYKKEHDAGTRWVWDFVKYYEENYKF